MPGRRPKPTALKRAQGNPGKRKLPAGEPEPEVRAHVPAPPAFLPQMAKTEWRRMARKLHRLRLLTDLDRAALAAYCEQWATYRKAVENIEEFGEVVVTPNGSLQQSPYMQIKNRSLYQMKAYLIEFGLTPAARSRIDVEAGGSSAEDDALADWLYGKETA